MNKLSCNTATPKRYWMKSAALSLAVATAFSASAALAASCPSVGDPQGVNSTHLGQLDLQDFISQTGEVEFKDNPLFADRVSGGELPPVEDRIPEDALVMLPYEDCGVYGGTLRGTAREPESGTSEILSWRQQTLVRLGDDLQTILPNVAKSWEWNDDFTEITFELRKGHKWSDGTPFTSNDILFYFEDILLNPDLTPTIPKAWVVGDQPVEAEKIDDLHIALKFAEPYPGLLSYLTTSAAYFAPYAPKHHYMPYHITYNPNADQEAKAAGFNGWVARFGQIYHRWKDAETLTAHALTRPTLESHIIEVEASTQRRIFAANPYYFKVDTAGQQLPYIDRHHERFLTPELTMLAALNGEIDQKAQGFSLAEFSVLKAGEDKGGYTIEMPPGGTGPYLAFNITHKDPALAAIYGDLRFREAISLALDRPEINEVIYFGLGAPQQAVPINAKFVSEDAKSYMIEHNLDRANALLDDMGMKRGSNGMRMRPDGEPYTLVWEYSSQFIHPEFARLVRDYFKSVGISVNPREMTSQSTREKAKAQTLELNHEWDPPFGVNMVGTAALYVPPYTDISPLFGISWQKWMLSGGSDGEEPPAWAKRMFEIAQEWKTLDPNSQRYTELGKELVRLNQENMTIIGTIGDLPRPVLVSNKLHNVAEWPGVNYSYGYQYAFRPDQWYFSE